MQGSGPLREVQKAPQALQTSPLGGPLRSGRHSPKTEEAAINRGAVPPPPLPLDDAVSSGTQVPTPAYPPPPAAPALAAGSGGAISPHTQSRLLSLQPVQHLVDQFLRGSPADAPQPSEVDDLRYLTEMRSWERVVQVAASMALSEPDRLVALDLHQVRVAALLRLNRVSEARMNLEESKKLEGAERQLNVQLSEIACTVAEGQPQDALDLACCLQSLLESHISSHSEVKFQGGKPTPIPSPVQPMDLDLRSVSVDEALCHRRQLMVSKLNILLSKECWRPAVAIISTLEEEVRSDPCERFAVLCMAGKVFCQVGALNDASRVFAECSLIAESRGELLPQMHFNDGLLAFARNEFVTARNNFAAAVQLLRSQLDAPPAAQAQAAQGAADTAAVAVDEGLLCGAQNNLALACLFSSHVTMAVDHLENSVRSNPTKNMSETVVQNLSTLYDLSCSAAASATKKRVLDAVARYFCLDDLAQRSTA